MKKLLSILLLSIFLITSPCFAQDNNTDKKAEEIAKILDSKEKPTIVYFYSKWCHYCRTATPIVHKLEKDLNKKYNFVYINTDENYSYAFSSYFRVDTVPTILIHNSKNNKNQRFTIIDANQKDIEELLNKYYKKNYSK